MRVLNVILIACLFTLTGLTQSAVPELVLEKRGSLKKKYIPEGTRVKVVMMDGTTYRGRFNVWEDMIVLEDQLINLGQVRRIRTKNAESVFTGTALTVLGSPVVATGSYIVVQSILADDECAQSCGLLFATPIIVAGGAMLIPGIYILAIGLGYSVDSWAYSVRYPEKKEKKYSLHEMFTPETFPQP